ncbi:EAL domain-containing protein [uncultured Novosphingobium sp.]|uniref:bifunctional diguanylate cyclase/phosphodiesterase n=1 Tax=uncultured Novosphingobium sp. TaxID=292277 RepID=UPI0025940C14|nr:EAL domain-containing protein [uncultured Novosphingobium sp.]
MEPLPFARIGDVFLCLRDQHRPGALLLAALVCTMAAATGVILMRQARCESGATRHNWATLAGVAFGFGTWATHFVALLAYTGTQALAFRLDLTLLSLVMALATAPLAMRLTLASHRQSHGLAAALVLGGGIAAMHYIGTAALEIPARIVWRPDMVALSILLPTLLWLPGLRLAVHGKGTWAPVGAALCLVAGVLLLHFTAVAAITLIPARPRSSGIAISPTVLTAWISMVSLGVFALGMTAQIVNRIARNALDESERRFSQLVKTISDYAICMLDHDGRISQWNLGAKRLTGYNAQEMIGLPIARLFTEEDRTAGLPNFLLAQARENGLHSGTGECLRQDGSRFWAHGTVEKLLAPSGEELGFSFVMHNITPFREAQALIAETSRHLDTALENMLQGLCLFDADQRVVLCNRRFREIWSLEEDDCRNGTDLAALIASGFMNLGGEQAGSQVLRNMKDILHETLADTGSAPIIADFGENHVISVANRALPEGGWVTTCDDITEQRKSEAKIAHMALHDPLTGLPNRTRFAMLVDELLAAAAPLKKQLAVIGVDLDRFKEINDSQGHAAGDLVLQSIAQRLGEMLGEGEAVARLGGDEFAACKMFANRSELNDFLARLRNAIIAPIGDSEHHFVVDGSIGIAICPNDGTDRETLLNNADLAMYRAKATLGENLCFFQHGMDETARQRRQLAADLRHAVDRGELSLLYQPQRSLHTGQLSAYEALLRWHHPTRGLVPPDDFIPIAEENGEIIRIGEWVLREACREARKWQSTIKIAVNLSPVQFLQPGLVETLREILVETGLSPSRLELEITETAIISDKLRALHCLRQIKSMGVSVAIDDFGTGYSSLDTLHSFPFDKIKIDKSFMSRAEHSNQARAIIRAVLALGRSLQIPVLAEGVETEKQLAVLRDEGCDEAQGYLFGRPAAPPREREDASEPARTASATGN